MSVGRTGSTFTRLRARRLRRQSRPTWSAGPSVLAGRSLSRSVDVQRSGGRSVHSIWCSAGFAASRFDHGRIVHQFLRGVRSAARSTICVRKTGVSWNDLQFLMGWESRVTATRIVAMRRWFYRGCRLSSASRLALVLGVTLFGNVISPMAVHADSDGYYCIGSEYLAYQFGLAAPSPESHRLYIVPLRAGQILGEPFALELPNFQVHGLLCGDNEVRLASFHAVYTVKLDGEMRPTEYTREEYGAEGQIPAEFGGAALPGNLAKGSPARGDLRVARLLLLRSDTGREFVLEMAPIARTATPCSVVLVTRLAEVGSSGGIVSDRVIFEGTVSRECGGLDSQRTSLGGLSEDFRHTASPPRKSLQLNTRWPASLPLVAPLNPARVASRIGHLKRYEALARRLLKKYSGPRHPGGTRVLRVLRPGTTTNRSHSYGEEERRRMSPQPPCATITFGDGAPGYCGERPSSALGRLTDAMASLSSPRLEADTLGASNAARCTSSTAF